MTLDLPFLATIFHIAGLKAMDPSERKRDVLDASTKALRDMMAKLLSTEPLTYIPVMHGQNLYAHMLQQFA
jgi:hypothetical protein